MKKNIKSRWVRRKPLLIRVMLPMLVLGLIQGIVFIAIMLISGELTYIEKYSSDFLIEKTANRASYMKSALAQKTQLTAQSADDISGDIGEYLYARGLSDDALKTDKSVSRDLLSAIAPKLIELMRGDVVNDAFVVLDTGELYGENTRAGLYFRDTDAYENSNAGYTDIYMEMGNSDIAHEIGIALDFEWSPTLDMGTDNNYDFYTVPLEAAQSSSGTLSTADFGYWSQFSKISRSSKESLKYSVPLIGSDGSVYGVLGIGLLDKTVLDAIPQNDFYKENSCYILGVDLNGSGNYTPVMHSGSIFTRLYAANPTFSDSTENQNGLCTYYSSSGTKFLGSIQNVELYSSGSPYYSHRWVMISAVEAGTVMNIYNFIFTVTVITVGVTLVLGAAFAVSTGRRLGAPVSRMIKKLHEIQPGDETVDFGSSGISEIDDLAESVTQLQKESNEYASRISGIINRTNSGIGIFMFDSHKQTVFAGESLIKILGMDGLPQRDTTIQSDTFLEELKKLDADGLLPTLNVFSDDFEEKNLTTEFQCRVHGENRWFVFIASRTSTGVIGMIQDITKTVAEKEEIAKDKDNEYTEKLLHANKALRDAYESARRANAAKTDFLSRMSHDIRTPMNAIIGMTTIAEANLDDQYKLSDCLDKISSSGRYLLSLINEVLDMSKIESSQFTLSEDQFSISELVGGVYEMVSASAKEKGHTLRFAKHDIIHDNVIGDKLRVQQIFMNIVGNAIKYTPPGGRITVDVSERRKDQNNISCYIIEFSDNGIGMSEEFLKKIFEPFERAEDDRVNKEQGTGLGMAITYNIVKMMGGDIVVASEPGKGSTFTVTLYLKIIERLDHSEKLTSAEEAVALMRTDFSGLTALLVEDNELNRMIASELLGMTGLTIECAVNGKEAVDKFEESAPGYYCAIFMDVQMPIMDGYEATRRIRALSRPDAAEIPIFAMTANAFAEDIKDAIVSGMNEHLAKPVEIKRLLEVMNKWIKK